MKLIIQIPCFNEEKSLPITFANLPKKIKGIEKIETLIIDDGSTDNTVETARKIGIDHIVTFNRNKGLARAFAAGIEKCLQLDADIIVNTDADNQYRGEDIAKLVEPIIKGDADVVIGDRQVDKISNFPWVKKKLQKIGSFLIRRLSKTNVIDAVSGFRAYSRDAAIQINILTEFSYTVENIIQLSNQKLEICSVPIRTNKQLRESRLFRSIPGFLVQQIATIIKVYSTYKALRVFTILGILIIIPGIYGFIRFLYFYFTEGGQGHIQSLIFSAVLLIIGFLVFVLGIISDLISNNRKLIEKVLYRIKKLELKNKKDEM